MLPLMTSLVSLWNDREEHCCPQLRFGQHFSSWSFHRETETPSAGNILPLLPAQACIIHILPIGKSPNRQSAKSAQRKNCRALSFRQHADRARLSEAYKRRAQHLLYHEQTSSLALLQHGTRSKTLRRKISCQKRLEAIRVLVNSAC